jgi:hypothetical protein
MEETNVIMKSYPAHNHLLQAQDLSQEQLQSLQGHKHLTILHHSQTAYSGTVREYRRQKYRHSKIIPKVM